MARAAWFEEKNRVGMPYSRLYDSSDEYVADHVKCIDGAIAMKAPSLRWEPNSCSLGLRSLKKKKHDPYQRRAKNAGLCGVQSRWALPPQTDAQLLNLTSGGYLIPLSLLP